MQSLPFRERLFFSKLYTALSPLSPVYEPWEPSIVGRLLFCLRFSRAATVRSPVGLPQELQTQDHRPADLSDDELEGEITRLSRNVGVRALTSAMQNRSPTEIAATSLPSEIERLRTLHKERNARAGRKADRVDSLVRAGDTLLDQNGNAFIAQHDASNGIVLGNLDTGWHRQSAVSAKSLSGRATTEYFQRGTGW